MSFLLYRAGIRPISEILHDNPLAQDYVRWGAPGPGRWVTIYATAAPTPHVFAVVAGLRIDTSHDGTDVGPNRNQNGPRWRIFDAHPVVGALVGAASAGPVVAELQAPRPIRVGST